MKGLFYGFIDALGAAKRALVNADNRLETYALTGGKTSVSNISADTVIKNSTGRVCRVSVTTAGSAAGAIHNCATVGAAAAGNLIAVIPNEVGVVDIDMPCLTGIVYKAGTGQVVTISYL